MPKKCRAGVNYSLRQSKRYINKIMLEARSNEHTQSTSSSPTPRIVEEFTFPKWYFRVIRPNNQQPVHSARHTINLRDSPETPSISLKTNNNQNHSEQINTSTSSTPDHFIKIDELLLQAFETHFDNSEIEIITLD